ncbi:MAG: hypothetical protein ACD_39C01316G0003 [uncultured bacterium]|nr:MAG: hypothetical protein ACD_39C01316G0003 [uncultured bacterium]
MVFFANADFPLNAAMLQQFSFKANQKTAGIGKVKYTRKIKAVAQHLAGVITKNAVGMRIRVQDTTSRHDTDNTWKILCQSSEFFFGIGEL